MCNRIFLAGFISIAMGFSAVTHARGHEIIEPDPIVLPENVNSSVIDKAVDGALLESAWIKRKVLSESPRAIEAEYLIRSHRISVKIEYVGSTLQLSYAGSENMKYKEKKGKRYIHKNYNVWVTALVDKIKENIALGDEYSYEASLQEKRARMSNAPPAEPFSNFSTFKLDNTTLAEAYTKHKGNKDTQRNLDHNLGVSLAPMLEGYSAKMKGGRTLLIKPHIEAVKFVGSGARFWAGSMAGRSWIYVKVSYIDEATNTVIGEADLYRVASSGNGWTLARNDYKMVEDMASDIARFTDNNYTNPVGGGQVPPEKIRKLAKD